MTRLCDALAVPRGLTSVVGGGGKTSLINRLARELGESARVLCFTTTHIRPPAGELLLSPTREALEAAFGRANVVTAGELCADGKLRAPNAPIMELIALADYALCEADGSRGLPVKAPAEHEPALLGAERLVIAVAGMSALGRPIAEAAHRPERYAALAGKRAGDAVTERDMALALASAQGQRKNVRCRYAALLNQCDTPRLEAAARECAALLGFDCALAALEARPDWLEIIHSGGEG